MEQVLICNDETFEECFERYAMKMRRWAVQYVPGLTQDEVLIEIQHTLWKAWSTFDEWEGATRGGHFGGYFHMMWTHHKGHLIQAFFAKKRQMSVAVTDEELTLIAASYQLHELPECPIEDRLVRRVWSLIARGYIPADVRDMLHITKRQMSDVMGLLRTDERVLAALVP